MLNDFGAFDIGSRDRDFAVGATSMKGEGDLVGVIIPIESIFHFVAVVVVVVVGKDFWGVDYDLVLAEELDY